MEMARHYRMAILAVDPGACNLSGLANDLPRMLDDIQEELGEIDPELTNEIDQMRQLAEVPTPDEPLYTTRWGEAYDICKEKGQE